MGDSPDAVRVCGDPGNSAIIIANNTFISMGVYGDAGGYDTHGQVEALRGLRSCDNTVLGPFGEVVNIGGVSAIGTPSFEHNRHSRDRTIGSVNRARIRLPTWVGMLRPDAPLPVVVSADPQWADVTTYELTP